MACGYRCVGREDSRRTDASRGLFEGQAGFYQVPYPLEQEKGRVSFVRMKDAGSNSEPGEHSHAADPENHLLFDTRLLIAAVESRGQLAVPRLVLLNIGVHQVERYRPYLDPPDRYVNLPSIEVEVDQPAADIARDHRLDRRRGVVEALVDCHLSAFR